MRSGEVNATFGSGAFAGRSKLSPSQPMMSRSNAGVIVAAGSLSALGNTKGRSGTVAAPRFAMPSSTGGGVSLSSAIWKMDATGAAAASNAVQSSACLSMTSFQSAASTAGDTPPRLARPRPCLQRRLK